MSTCACVRAGVCQHKTRQTVTHGPWGRTCVQAAVCVLVCRRVLEQSADRLARTMRAPFAPACLSVCLCLVSVSLCLCACLSGAHVLLLAFGSTRMCCVFVCVCLCACTSRGVHAQSVHKLVKGPRGPRRGRRPRHASLPRPGFLWVWLSGWRDDDTFLDSPKPFSSNEPTTPPFALYIAKQTGRQAGRQTGMGSCWQYGGP